MLPSTVDFWKFNWIDTYCFKETSTDFSSIASTEGKKHRQERRTQPSRHNNRLKIEAEYGCDSQRASALRLSRSFSKDKAFKPFKTPFQTSKGALLRDILRFPLQGLHSCSHKMRRMYSQWAAYVRRMQVGIHPWLISSFAYRDLAWLTVI